MNELMMSDLYTISASYPLDNIHMRCVFLLYQPLIGHDACSLYLSLNAELDQLTLTKSPSLHSRLSKITGMSLTSLKEASLKLEAIGLISKYVKDDNNRTYLYVLKTPLTPTKFFNHSILGPLLNKRLGDEEYYRTKLCFKAAIVSSEGFSNVTAKFTDIFDINLINGSDNVIVEKDYFQANYGKVKVDYDMSLFYQGLEDYQIKKSSITNDDEIIIKQLGMMYRINGLDMQGLVKDSMYGDKIDHNQLTNKCRDYYDLNMPDNFKEIYHHQSIINKSSNGDDPLSKHINYLESITPYQLLKDKQGGREPLKRDLQIVESIMTSLYLEPGVVNVLIELTLSQCDNVISRSFMQSRASQWKRKKIVTVKEAMDEATLYLKYRHENKEDNEDYKKEIKVVNNDDINVDELDEFLKQFE